MYRPASSVRFSPPEASVTDAVAPPTASLSVASLPRFAVVNTIPAGRFVNVTWYVPGGRSVNRYPPLPAVVVVSLNAAPAPVVPETVTLTPLMPGSPLSC